MSVVFQHNTHGEDDGWHWKTGRHRGLPLRGREKDNTLYKIRIIHKITNIQRRGNPPWLPECQSYSNITHMERAMAGIGRRAGTGACPYGEGKKTIHCIRSGSYTKLPIYNVGATPRGCPDVGRISHDGHEERNGWNRKTGRHRGLPLRGINNSMTA
uniref:Uncharacterized protein n=1 Tax=Chlorobium phaeobacteroides (strain BS1) TaxID=331678 RepID=B3EQ45_CHLPB